MEDNYFKYPKTWHCPESKPDPHGNDRVLDNLDHFTGKSVICTTKMDGENTTMYRDKIHARSIDSGYHPSRTWVKALHASIRNNIPPNWRICGENMQAKHAIYYENLPTYFFAFGVYDDKNVCLSWGDTVHFCQDLGLQLVPVLGRDIWCRNLVAELYTGRTIIDGYDCGEQEGYVVRTVESFHYDDFANHVYKWVRPGHVAGDSEHWSKTGYKPNKLRK